MQKLFLSLCNLVAQLAYWVNLEEYIEKFLIQLLVKQRQLDLLQSFTPAWDITVK